MSPRRQTVEIEAAAVPASLREAADLFEARQSGADEPEGSWEDRIWLPSDRERRACCAELVPDKLKDPQKLRNHCRTLLHVANLFNLDGRLLRTELRRRRDHRGVPPATTAAARRRSRPARSAPAAPMPAGTAGTAGAASEEARTLHETLVRLIGEHQAKLRPLANLVGERCEELLQQLEEGRAVEVAIAESQAGDVAGDLRDLIDDITQLVITRDTIRRVLGLGAGAGDRRGRTSGGAGGGDFSAAGETSGPHGAP